MIKSIKIKVKKKVLRFDRGYSLVEMLTVVTVFGVLALASTSVFFSSLVGSSKEAVLREIKQNGEFAVVQIENLLRNAEAIRYSSTGELCDLDMRALAIKSFDGKNQEIAVDEGKLVLREMNEFGDIVKQNDMLSGEGIMLVQDTPFGTPFSINCSWDEGSGSALVEVVFTLTKDVNPGVSEDQYAETFRAKVNLRNKIW